MDLDRDVAPRSEGRLNVASDQNLDRVWCIFLLTQAPAWAGVLIDVGSIPGTSFFDYGP